MKITDLIRASIIIPTFNSIKTIEPLLHSLDNQSMASSDFEIIVVDDLSTDGTREFLHSHKTESLFQLIMQDKNSGIGAARNRAIGIAKSDILLFLDSDMEVDPDWVENHTVPMENGEWDGSVGKVTHDINSSSVFTRYLNDPRRGAKRFDEDQQLNHKYFLFGNASLRKKFIIGVGGFDEKIIKWGGEELDLILRIESKVTLKLRYNSSAKAIHHQQRSLEDTCKLLENFGANIVPYLIKRHPVLADEFKINAFEKFFVKKALMLTIFNPIFFWMMKKTYKFAPRPLAFNIIKYLLSYSVLKGYQSRPEIMDHNQND